MSDAVKEAMDCSECSADLIVIPEICEHSSLKGVTTLHRLLLKTFSIPSSLLLVSDLYKANCGNNIRKKVILIYTTGGVRHSRPWAITHVAHPLCNHQANISTC
jgi:hypothetical protein